MKNSLDESNGRSSDGRHCDGESVRRALEIYTEEIVKSELEEAYDQLEASQSLCPETIETIAKMARRISGGIMAAPLASLEDSSEPDIRETISDLFELEGKRGFENDLETRSDDVSIDT